MTQSRRPCRRGAAASPAGRATRAQAPGRILWDGRARGTLCSLCRHRFVEDSVINWVAASLKFPISYTLDFFTRKVLFRSSNKIGQHWQTSPSYRSTCENHVRRRQAGYYGRDLHVTRKKKILLRSRNKTWFSWSIRLTQGRSDAFVWIIIFTIIIFPSFYSWAND